MIRLANSGACGADGRWRLAIHRRAVSPACGHPLEFAPKTDVARIPFSNSTGTRVLRFATIAAMLCFAAIAAVLCLPGAYGGSTVPTDTERLAPGVWHHSIDLFDGPWAIHVVEIDLLEARKAGIRLRTARPPAEGLGLVRTSDLAADALAAINGDFFQAGTPGRPLGVQISEGELIGEPRSRSAFALAADGRPQTAVFELDAGLITRSGQVLPLSRLNRAPRSDGELTLYNRHAGSREDSVRAPVGFFLQSLDGTTSLVNDTAAVRVVQMRRQAWPLLLQRGQWLVAGGADFAREAAISPGDTVHLYCALPPSKGSLDVAIGGGPRIIRDGRVSIEHEREHLGESFANDRHPRSAIGLSRGGRHVFLVTVDGRQPGHSVGMTLPELAELLSADLAGFTKSRHNAWQAINLDGGGSTTMVVREQVVNRPSDQTGERPVANALVVMPPAAAG